MKMVYIYIYIYCDSDTAESKSSDIKSDTMNRNEFVFCGVLSARHDQMTLVLLQV